LHYYLGSPRFARVHTVKFVRRFREALIFLSTDLDHLESAHVYARARHIFQWAYLFSCRRLCPAPSRESRCTQWLSPAKSASIADEHRSTPAKWAYYGTPLLLEALNAGTRVELLDAGLESEQRDRVFFRQAYATCKQSLHDW